MKIVENLGKKIITDWTMDSQFGWPPSCTALIYQPERPVSSCENHSVSQSSSDSSADE